MAGSLKNELSAIVPTRCWCPDSCPRVAVSPCHRGLQVEASTRFQRCVDGVVAFKLPLILSTNMVFHTRRLKPTALERSLHFARS